MSQEFDDLLFGVRRSVRYHSRRQKFFQNCHTLLMIFTMVAASLTFAANYPSSTLAESWPDWIMHWLPALIALFAIVDVVIGFSNKAWRHGDFMRGFNDLQCEMEALHLKGNASADDVARLTKERLRIEADEPPVLHVLNTICHNELMRAMGYRQDEMVKITFFQRLLAPFFDWREQRLDYG